MASTMDVGLEITELRLGLPGDSAKPEKKRAFSEIDINGNKTENKSKAPVVGWPPVCSFRQRLGIGEKDSNSRKEEPKAFVKISMDGVPFLRKVDVVNHQGYTDLVAALEKLFGYIGVGDANKGYDNTEYVPIYEDEDGDWMLLGDVPWKMFVESCKRLRIMKKSEAKGIGLQSKKHKGYYNSDI